MHPLVAVSRLHPPQDDVFPENDNVVCLLRMVLLPIPQPKR